MAELINVQQDDYDEEDAVCERCHGDGRDPWNDYLLPCPLCQGEQLAKAREAA